MQKRIPFLQTALLTNRISPVQFEGEIFASIHSYKNIISSFGTSKHELTVVGGLQMQIAGFLARTDAKNCPHILIAVQVVIYIVPKGSTLCKRIAVTLNTDFVAVKHSRKAYHRVL